MDIVEDRNLKKGIVCKIDGCNRGAYSISLELCRKHYAIYKYRGNRVIDIRRCKAPDCKKNVTFSRTGREYCTSHYYRHIHNLPLDLSIKLIGNKHCNHFKGEKNVNWNGGISEYKNHYTMKQMRIKIFEKVNNKCELCGEPAKHIHHKDCTKDNHDEDNLIAVCCLCHGALHSGENNKSSKYKKMYGFTMLELSKKYETSSYILRGLHRRKELDRFIERRK